MSISVAPGLSDTPMAATVEARHRVWAGQLPAESDALWDWLLVLDSDSRQALFAHCVALTVNAMHESWNRRPKAMAHADRLAEAVSLDERRLEDDSGNTGNADRGRRHDDFVAIARRCRRFPGSACVRVGRGLGVSIFGMRMAVMSLWSRIRVKLIVHLLFWIRISHMKRPFGQHKKHGMSILPCSQPCCALR
jgi:hypothetical protein